MRTLAKCVLITGTTSGIGRAFLEHYHREGWRVVSVNRRAEKNADEFKNALFLTSDITSYDSVKKLLESLIADGMEPDLFLLNAGINRVDNNSFFDFPMMESVIQTNMNGVLTFVGAASARGLTNKIFFGVSSTSNIVANPGNIGYHISKLSIKNIFDLLRKADTKNVYKTVVLGPVKTNIMDGSPPLQGFQKIIFDLLAVSPTEAVPKMVGFIEGSRKTLYFTKMSVLFYYTVFVALQFFPAIYKGSRDRG